MDVVLTTFDKWQDVLKTFKGSHGRCETNCYLSEQAIAEYIDCKRMSFEIIDDTLWLFEHEPGYDIAYYYVVKNKEISTITGRDTKQIIYLIGDEGRYRAEKREQELIYGGFQKYRKNLEYLISKDVVNELKNADSKCSRFMKKFDVHYDWPGSESDYHTAFDMWSERIDRYSVKLALPSVIKRMIDNHECMLIKNSHDDIVAACQYEVGGSRGFSENIAVKGENNGAGLGAGLLYHSFLYIINHGIDNTTYVWEENLESRRITERFGKLTGRFSQQLIL